MNVISAAPLLLLLDLLRRAPELGGQERPASLPDDENSAAGGADQGG